MNNTNDFLRDYYLLRKQWIESRPPLTRYGLLPWLTLALIILLYVVYFVGLSQLCPGQGGHE